MKRKRLDNLDPSTGSSGKQAALSEGEKEGFGNEDFEPKSASGRNSDAPTEAPVIEFKPIKNHEKNTVSFEKADAGLSDIKSAAETKKDKKNRNLQNFSYFWSFVSAVYAIVSTIIFIAEDWVSDTAAYVLIGFMALYVAIFAVIFGLTRNDKRKGRKHIALYAKLLRIFKAFASVVFLVISAVGMAGVASGGMGVAQWTVFLATFFVAILQLGLKIALFVIQMNMKRVGRRYNVTVTRFVNGEKQHDKLQDKVYKSLYKSDKD